MGTRSSTSSSARHDHSRAAHRVHEQADRFPYTSFTVASCEPYARLAERVSAPVSISGEARVACFNPGTEAVASAAKLALLHARRHAVIAFARRSAAARSSR